METVWIDLLPQLGLAAVILYLLMEERKARQKLEDKIVSILDELMDNRQKKQTDGL